MSDSGTPKHARRDDSSNWIEADEPENIRLDSGQAAPEAERQDDPVGEEDIRPIDARVKVALVLAITVVGMVVLTSIFGGEDKEETPPSDRERAESWVERDCGIESEGTEYQRTSLGFDRFGNEGHIFYFEYPEGLAEVWVGHTETRDQGIEQGVKRCPQDPEPTRVFESGDAQAPPVHATTTTRRASGLDRETTSTQPPATATPLEIDPSGDIDAQVVGLFAEMAQTHCPTEWLESVSQSFDGATVMGHDEATAVLYDGRGFWWEITLDGTSATPADESEPLPLDFAYCDPDVFIGSTSH